MDPFKPQQEPLPKSRVKEITEFLEHRFGSNFLEEGERLLQQGGNVILTTEDAARFRMPMLSYAMGLPFGKRMTKSPIMLDHDLVTLRGTSASSNTIDLTDDLWSELTRGQDIDCDPELLGNVVMLYNSFCVGRGRAKEGRLKNHLPRWMVQMLSS